MSPVSPIKPPRRPLKFLRFFVKKDFLEEIEGDMEEIFSENVERVGQTRARRMYTAEMLKLLRPILIKNLEGVEKLNQYGMLKNYFKVSFRGLLKNPLNSAINIIGLAVAIGIAIFAYAFTRWTYSTDQFHEHKNEIFLVTFFADRDGTSHQYGTTPRPLGEMLREDFAQIKKVCRLEDRSVVVKFDDNVYHERVRFTDAEFGEMFTFPMKWGTAKSLKDVNSIVLSEDMAIKYFGEENPIGQNLVVKFDKDRGKAFKVTGVAQAFPKARSFSFNFLVNLENLREADRGFDFHDWKSQFKATFIQMARPEDVTLVAQRMEKYRKLQSDAVQEDWAITSFAFEPLATLHEKTESIRDDISRSSSSNYKTVIWLGAICFLMLALACFNYINIAIVSAAKRLKEIGVRKSIGATRLVVIIQFLTENVVITFFALLAGLVLAAFVFIPWFEQQWSFSMGFSLADKTLWIYLPVILLITGIASGFYPAFYISRFQVVGILKGVVQFGGKNLMTKMLLGIQLVLACVFMTAAIMFAQNNRYLAHRSWGYDQEAILYAVVPDHLGFEQLSARMAQNPGVVSVSGSTHHLGRSQTVSILHFPNRQIEVDQLSVGANYFETMGLPLKDGRFFNDHEGSDHKAVVVNELLVKNLAWRNPIGQQFKIDSVTYEVVGVVKDFHAYSFFTPMRPVVFRVADKSEYRYLSMKVRSGSAVEVHKDLQANWASLFPDVPFEGGYQEDVWGDYYAATEIYDKVWTSISFMAVLLAALGLYGLVTLNVTSRVREFSIRKVLGAGVSNLAVNIVAPYLILFAIALIIGTPLSYVFTTFLLESVYEVHMPITFFGVTLAGSMLILVLLLTASSQIRKVALSNPVDGLKVE